MSEVKKSSDTIYTQRAALAVALARMILMQGGRAGFCTGKSMDDWPVLYIDLPDGKQISFHISREDSRLLEGLPTYTGEWNGTYLGRGSEWLEAIPMPTDFERVVTVEIADAVARRRLKGHALNRWYVERKKLQADTDILPEVAAQILMGYAER